MFEVLPHLAAQLVCAAFVAGFVDGGGYTNFTGPNINMTRGDSRFILSAWITVSSSCFKVT
mgnify:CR=1 FL=1